VQKNPCRVAEPEEEEEGEDIMYCPNCKGHYT